MVAVSRRLGGLLRQATDWDFIVPSVVAAVLALPCLGLGYFWDDFAFLSRVQSNPAAALSHQPNTAFYRPLSQGLYFLALVPFGNSGAVMAHGLNLLLLVASICILVSLTRSLAGRRAGLVAGLILAGVAPAASLAGWASGAQDLLAIMFLLAALHLHHSGHTSWATAAAAAGLLSKETIAVVWPVLVFWDAIVGRKPARIVAPLLAFGGLALTWAVLHPGIRFLAGGGFELEGRSYVGLQNTAVVKLNTGRYLAALFNIPLMGWNTPWPGDRIGIGVLALLLAVGGCAVAARSRSVGLSASSLSLPRAAVLGSLIALPMLLLPSFIIQRWVAYYVCLPAVGSAIFLGTVAARRPLAQVLAGLVVYMALGTWSRGVWDPRGSIMTERSFVEASKASSDIEAAFRTLRPQLPRGSQILVSVAASGMAGIHGTLHHGQALRTWYGDPNITTLTPERRAPGARAEYLFRITSARDLVEIVPDQVGYRSTGRGPGAEELHAVVRTYARGLAASGEIERSVRILGLLARRDSILLRSYDLRLAAMALLAHGDRPRAEQVLATATPIPRDFALDGVARIMGEPTSWAEFDSCAYWAFGVSSSDPEALRYWTAMFYGSEYFPQALHFARRLEEVAPGHPDAAFVLRRLGHAKRRLRSRAARSRYGARGGRNHKRLETSSA